MSKKITHEQAREGLLQVYIFNDIYINEINYELVRTYISQQEELEQHQKHSFVNELSGILYDLKQTEKLLELYKEYFKYSEMLKDGRKFGGRMLVEHERDKIIEEIKELENEKSLCK